jgi:hypothetical protein
MLSHRQMEVKAVKSVWEVTMYKLGCVCTFSMESHCASGENVLTHHCSCHIQCLYSPMSAAAPVWMGTVVALQTALPEALSIVSVYRDTV